MPASSHRLAGTPDPIETRLQVVAAMLDKAVVELHVLMSDIKTGIHTDDDRGTGTADD